MKIIFVDVEETKKISYYVQNPLYVADCLTIAMLFAFVIQSYAIVGEIVQQISEVGSVHVVVRGWQRLPPTRYTRMITVLQSTERCTVGDIVSPYIPRCSTWPLSSAFQAFEIFKIVFFKQFREQKVRF